MALNSPPGNVTKSALFKLMANEAGCSGNDGSGSDAGSNVPVNPKSNLPGWVLVRAREAHRGIAHPAAEELSGLPEFLTIYELAVIWRVSVRTVRRCLAAGLIPHIRVGRQVRIPRKAVPITELK